KRPHVQEGVWVARNAGKTMSCRVETQRESRSPVSWWVANTTRHERTAYALLTSHAAARWAAPRLPGAPALFSQPRRPPASHRRRRPRPPGRLAGTGPARRQRLLCPRLRRHAPGGAAHARVGAGSGPGQQDRRRADAVGDGVGPSAYGSVVGLAVGPRHGQRT